MAKPVNNPDHPHVPMKLKTKITLILASVLTGGFFNLKAEAGFPPPLDFSHPHMPYLNWNPGPEYCDSVRMFQGIPSIASAPGGRLWATWYGGGTGESQDNYVLLATSADDGRTWSNPQLIIDPPFRASEPALWTDPSGRLWFMFNLYPIRSSVQDRNDMKDEFEDIDAYNRFIGKYNFVGTQLWVMATDDPDEENPTWSEPRLLAMETHNMNKPTVLGDGTWIWPASPVISRRGLMPQPLFSTDGGHSFFYRGHIPVPRELRNAHEYQVIEREDGSLWALNRIRADRREGRSGIGESFSYDGGETWSEMKPSETINHTTSRFFITRLQSGNLLLVKHGPIDQDVGRSELMAFLSDDDGESWFGGLMIDERPRISYPDGEQGSDGLIRIIYDYNRHHDKEILMAIFTEEDVAAGEPVSDEAAFRLVVNKATGFNPVHESEEQHAVEQWMLDAGQDTGGKPFEEENRGAWADEDFVALPFEKGVQLFSDRPRPSHFAADIPEEFQGAHILQTPIGGEKTLRVARSGVLYVLTPEPRRNPDSQSLTLLAQGFTKVDFPEFHLLSPGPPDRLVTLYQKEISEGETITIGKWAVPVFWP